MDRFLPFFKHFPLAARVFYAGQLCGTSSDHTTGAVGHVHVLRSGVLHLTDKRGRRSTVKEPSVLLFLHPEQHTFQSDGADLVCAFVDFGAGTLNPLASSLPSYLALPLSSMVELRPTIDLLFSEAFDRKDGRQVAVDRLTEYLLILIFRFLLTSNLIQGGLLMALSDSRLARVIAAILDAPERAWTLEELGKKAGMSRARFAAHFLAITGQTPFEYLAVWRIGVAQSLLKKGKPLKMIAPSVGFASSGALIRSFSRHVGMPPMAWLAVQQNGEI